MSKLDNLMKEEPKEEKGAPSEIKKEIKQEVRVAAKKEDGGDKVELTKDEFSSLMARLNRLEKTSNKARTAVYDRMNQEDPETIFKLRTINGKVVTGWSGLITNEVNVDPETRKYHEDQTLEVYYEDDTKEKMTLVVFNRRYKYIPLLLKEETVLRDKEKIAIHGNRIFKLIDEESNKEYLIGEKFVN